MAGKNVSTWGYNGSLLGPAIRLQRHQPVTVNINNTLPTATTLHWHGLKVGEKLTEAHWKLSPQVAVVRLRLPRTRTPQPVGITPIYMDIPDFRSPKGWLAW